MVVYVYCRKYPDEDISVWGIPLKRKILPWVMLGLDTLMGSSPLMGILGIAAGHLYWYLTDGYQRNTGAPLLTTPQFL